MAASGSGSPQQQHWSLPLPNAAQAIEDALDTGVSASAFVSEAPDSSSADARTASPDRVHQSSHRHPSHHRLSAPSSASLRYWPPTLTAFDADALRTLQLRTSRGFVEPPANVRARNKLEQRLAFPPFGALPLPEPPAAAVPAVAPVPRGRRSGAAAVDDDDDDDSVKSRNPIDQRAVDAAFGELAPALPPSVSRFVKHQSIRCL